MSDIIPTKIITGEQIKGARAMLRLDQAQFSALTHLSVSTIRRLERTRGPVITGEGAVKALCEALEQAGIELIDAGHYEGIGGPGIRLAGAPDVVTEEIDFETAAEELEADKPAVPGAP